MGVVAASGAAPDFEAAAACDDAATACEDDAEAREDEAAAREAATDDAEAFDDEDDADDEDAALLREASCSDGFSDGVDGAALLVEVEVTARLGARVCSPPPQADRRGARARVMIAARRARVCEYMVFLTGGCNGVWV